MIHLTRFAAMAVSLVILEACSARRAPPASSPTRPPAETTPPRTVDEARAALQAGIARLQKGDFAGAATELQAVIDCPAFSALERAERHDALSGAGEAALEQHDAGRTHALLFRASTMEEATPFDWFARLDAALELRDEADAILCLTVIARRWPDKVDIVGERVVTRLAGVASEEREGSEAGFHLLDALFDARWEPRSGRPSWAWKELALRWIERGAIDRAREVAAQVTAPTSLVAMRVDRRFDVVVAAGPDRFDVARAQALELERLRTAVMKEPASMAVVLQLTSSLSSATRYAEVLEVADAALRLLESQGPPRSDEAIGDLAWVLNAKARALSRLGRWGDAVEQLSRASLLAPPGRRNVSQSINLAGLYCDLGRPEEALAAIAGVIDVSPYGRMQLESVRASVAHQRGDGAALARALDYLREHQADAPGTLQATLVEVGGMTEASGLIVARLEDPRRRSEAILEVQHFAAHAETPRMTEWRTRWDAMVARPEVQAAIAKVGRVERFDMERP